MGRDRAYRRANVKLPGHTELRWPQCAAWIRIVCGCSCPVSCGIDLSEIAERLPSVDNFEDARFPKFNIVQQRSISGAYLIETECVENEPVFGKAANGLLSRWSLVRVQPRLPQFVLILRRLFASTSLSSYPIASSYVLNCAKTLSVLRTRCGLEKFSK
jgi:hypothetical protein